MISPSYPARASLKRFSPGATELLRLHIPTNSQQEKLVFTIAILAALSLAVWMSWTGFIGSDDQIYASAARRWLADGPFVGMNHFTVRLTTILPIALSFKLLGQNEFALIVPTLIFGLATVALVSALAMRVLSPRLSLFAVVPFVTSPLFASMCSTPCVDLVELFFDLASLLTFVVALNATRRGALLLLAGLLAGLAWMSRETSIFLPTAYGILFLCGYRIGRREYLLVAAGFLAIALGEMLVYFILTGDPLHRLLVSYHHDLVDRDRTHSLFDREGNVHVNGLLGTFLNPFLMIFFNKEFGIAFWLSVPAAVWLIRTNSLSPKVRTALQTTSIVGAIWMLGVFSLVTKLYLAPRYLLFPLTTSALLVGAWLGLGVFPRFKWRAIAIVVAAVAVNLLAIGLEDHDFLFPERTLVAYARTARSPIYTDRETHRRAQFLLESEGLAEKVTDEPHHLGDVFFYVPDNVAYIALITKNKPHLAGLHALYAPLKGETIVAEITRPESWVGRLLDGVRVSGSLPKALMKKVRGNQRGALVYSAPSRWEAGADNPY